MVAAQPGDGLHQALLFQGRLEVVERARITLQGCPLLAQGSEHPRWTQIELAGSPPWRPSW